MDDCISNKWRDPIGDMAFCPDEVLFLLLMAAAFFCILGSAGMVCCWLVAMATALFRAIVMGELYTCKHVYDDGMKESARGKPFDSSPKTQQR
jgi:hypothetical protein